MLDQLRHQIQARLDELLAEAEKLRHALAALGSRDGAAPRSESDAPSAAPERARSRVRSAPTSRKPARSLASTATATAEPVEAPASASASGPDGAPARAASGSTKNAVLQALAGGSAMTAGEVATATGLGRASVSTTLSKLAKSGEVAKADRGYQLADRTSPVTSADAARIESEPPAA
jgi:hypothetical protein